MIDARARVVVRVVVSIPRGRKTSRKHVSKCLKRLKKDLQLGYTLGGAYVPFNNRVWHRMSLSREGEFLAEGIALPTKALEV